MTSAGGAIRPRRRAGPTGACGLDDTQTERVKRMPKLIDSCATIQHPLGRRLFEMFQRPVESLLAIDRLNDHYDLFREEVLAGGPPESVFDAALKVLGVRFEVDDEALNRIPAQGPLVVVANHPFGAIEGVIMGAMLLRVRPDVRILGNYLLKRIIGIRDYILAVDPFEGKQAKALNISGIKQCLAWLRGGGALGAFPSGEVASWHPGKGGVTEPAWTPHVAAMIRISQATALPVYFPGRNSASFMAMGLLHSSLRTALLPRELINKSGQGFSVHLGRPIPWDRLRRFANDAAVIGFLRLNTDILKAHRRQQRARAPFTGWSSKGKRPSRPLMEPVAGSLMRQDVERLPDAQRLVQSRDFGVYISGSAQIPHVINEIGRLRELTFREAREGTGRSIDLDRFDAHYSHLFLWNHATSEVVGAYRLGLVDRILEDYGLKGLYTSTLFRFKPDFIRRLPPAIEFGRSFIRPEYQKKFNCLVLIWRGIGQFIRRCPRYQVLFGPVSISRDYHAVSRTLLVHYLKESRFNPVLSRCVAPRRPYRSALIGRLDKNALKAALRDIEDVSFLISGIESDGKGVPVLLKHYLNLNAKLLGFNVDKAFANVVDGLLMVDLRETDQRIVNRFIGSLTTAPARPEGSGACRREAVGV